MSVPPSDPALALARRVAAGEAVDPDEFDAIDPLQARGLRRVATIARSLAPDTATGATWGHLQRLQPVGSGSFGEVFRAYDPTLDRSVALKLKRHDAPSAIFSGRDFVAEAQRLAQVRHPNVLAVHGASYHDGRAGLWADWIDGETLQACLQRERSLSPARVLVLAQELACALAAVHAAGLVHGDVKPANVMIDQRGHAVLMDFGAGFRSGDEAAVLTAATPDYLAPEVGNGAPVTAAVDLYALGVLLHRAVCGVSPQPGAVSARLRPVALRRLLMGLLAASPSARPSAAATVQRLDHLRAAPLRRARRLALAALFAGLAGIAAVSAVAYLRSETLRAQAEQAHASSEASASFLSDLIASAAPQVLGPRASLRDLLDAAPALVEQRFAQRPQERLRALQLLSGLEADFGNEAAAARLAVAAATAAQELAPDSDRALALQAQSLRLRAIAGEALLVQPLAEALLQRLQTDGRAPALIARVQYDLAEIEFRCALVQSSPALHQRMRARLQAVLAQPQGLDAPTEIAALRRLATLEVERGEAAVGIALIERALARAETSLGRDHLQAALVRRMLGWYVMEAEDAVVSARRAEALFRSNLALHRHKLGGRSATVADDLIGLSYALMQQQHHAEALPIARRAWELNNALYARDHRSVIDSGLTLADALAGNAQAAAATTMLEDLRARLTTRRGQENRQYLLATRQLAQLWREHGQPALAARLFAECAQVGTRAFGADYAVVRDCQEHSVTIAAAQN